MNEEHGSKNHPGGLRDFRVENKTVSCHAIPENVPKCLVFILNLYMKQLPRVFFEKDILYLRPKTVFSGDYDSPWYENRPMGKNVLSNMMKVMSEEC